MSTELPTNDKGRDMVIEGIDEDPDPNIFKHDGDQINKDEIKQNEDMNSTFTVWKGGSPGSTEGTESPGRHPEDVKNRQSVIMKGPRQDH